MKKNLFEMGAQFEDTWVSDNKQPSVKSPAIQIKAPDKHRLYFAKEKRRGKVVTIVKPFCLDKPTLQNLLKTLKKKLGAGGTVKEDTLELQGDISDLLRPQLEKLHFRFGT